MSLHVPEKHRFTAVGHFYSSTKQDGNNGLFNIPVGKCKVATVLASDGGGWEHVSVSFTNRTPTWSEMNKIKSIFWDDDDCVMQLHPPKSNYVNVHQHCLHMWRPVDQEIPLPPMVMV